MEKRRQAHKQAVDEVFTREVPEEYAGCRPKAVPELIGVQTRGEVGACFRGKTGIGKTYAATALAYRALSCIPCRFNPVTGRPAWEDTPLVWVAAPELTRRLRGSFNHSGESTMSIMERCIYTHVLMLDDLGAGKITEFVCETFYDIISSRVNARRCTIVTTNQSLNEINEWEPRIASRLGAFLTIDLPEEDRRLPKR